MWPSNFTTFFRPAAIVVDEFFGKIEFKVDDDLKILEVFIDPVTFISQIFIVAWVTFIYVWLRFERFSAEISSFKTANDF